jgi:hypothetical protein
VDGGCVLDDTEEYEVVFEEQDTVEVRFLSCTLNVDCSDVNKEALELKKVTHGIG